MSDSPAKNFQNSTKEEMPGIPSFFLVPLFLAVVLADQLTKFLAGRRGLVFRNYNFAFSLPLPVWAMYGIYAAVLGGLGYYLYSRRNRLALWQKAAWILVIAGALCNIGERLYLGYVRDFIYIFTGVLNVADFAILFGLILLLFWQPAEAKKI